MRKDGDLAAHNNTLYHKNAVSSAEHFCKVYEKPGTSIINRLATDRAKNVEENRNRLKPIIKSIIFLGRQNIALRGHKDDGDINNNENITNNDGNFRQLLKYRAENDTLLAEHLTNAKSNATYISKTTQNEIIGACGVEITNQIFLNRIQAAKFFSIIFDERTDISTISQLSLYISYVYDNKRYEDFIQFLNIHESAVTSDNGQHEQVEPKVSGKSWGNWFLD